MMTVTETAQREGTFLFLSFSTPTILAVYRAESGMCCVMFCNNMLISHLLAWHIYTILSYTLLSRTLPSHTLPSHTLPSHTHCHHTHCRHTYCCYTYSHYCHTHYCLGQLISCTLFFKSALARNLTQYYTGNGNQITSLAHFSLSHHTHIRKHNCSHCAIFSSWTGEGEIRAEKEMMTWRWSLEMLWNQWSLWLPRPG